MQVRMRSGWAIPGNRPISGQSWKANRIDRSVSANSVPQNLAIYGVYNLTFRQGGNWKRQLAGAEPGWGMDFLEVFTYISGTPLLITTSSCWNSFQPTAGTCMPDINPNLQRKDYSAEWKLGQRCNAKKLGAAPPSGSNSYLNGYVGTAAQGAEESNAAARHCTSCASAPRSATLGISCLAMRPV